MDDLDLDRRHGTDCAVCGRAATRFVENTAYGDQHLCDTCSLRYGLERTDGESDEVRSL